VVMVSGTSSTDVDLTVEALSRGALDFVPKPVGRDPETSRRELVRVLKPIINAFRTRWLLRGGASARPAIREYRPPPKVSRPRTTGRVRGVPPARLSLLAIGVSTGGPNALHELVPALSPQLSLPVLIVQHMPAGFTRSLAAKLDRVCGLEVREAEDGDEIRAGRILIAPGGRHMVGRKLDSRLVVGITDGTPVKSCRLSVDVLFRSLAGLTPSAILTLTLTGMGDDGADGVQTLARYGSYNLVQDEETCVVYGMPRAVNERGLAHEVHPLSRLAARINDLGRRGPRGARR